MKIIFSIFQKQIDKHAHNLCPVEHETIASADGLETASAMVRPTIPLLLPPS